MLKLIWKILTAFFHKASPLLATILTNCSMGQRNAIPPTQRPALLDSQMVKAMLWFVGETFLRLCFCREKLFWKFLKHANEYHESEVQQKSPVSCPTVAEFPRLLIASMVWDIRTLTYHPRVATVHSILFLHNVSLIRPEMHTNRNRLSFIKHTQACIRNPRLLNLQSRWKGSSGSVSYPHGNRRIGDEKSWTMNLTFFEEERPAFLTVWKDRMQQMKETIYIFDVFLPSLNFCLQTNLLETVKILQSLKKFNMVYYKVPF